MLEALHRSLFDPNTLLGATLWGMVFIVLAMALAALVRKFSRRIEPHLSDVTGLRFVSAFAQVVAYLVGFILYAHLVPELRALGTALLAGVSIVSIVLGLAAQNTLGNLIAGLSLVLYRPIRVGDELQLTTPRGLMTAKVELVSLGYTILCDEQGNQIVVPNSVVASSVVIRLARTAKPGNTAA